jgi:hypothetical protein
MPSWELLQPPLKHIINTIYISLKLLFQDMDFDALLKEFSSCLGMYCKVDMSGKNEIHALMCGFARKLKNHHLLSNKQMAA